MNSVAPPIGICQVYTCQSNMHTYTFKNTNSIPQCLSSAFEITLAIFQAAFSFFVKHLITVVAYWLTRLPRYAIISNTLSTWNPGRLSLVSNVDFQYQFKFTQNFSSIFCSVGQTMATCHTTTSSLFSNVRFGVQQLLYSWDDRWTFVKLYPQNNDFWAPDGDRTCNFLMTGETL